EYGRIAAAVAPPLGKALETYSGNHDYDRRKQNQRPAGGGARSARIRAQAFYRRADQRQDYVLHAQSPPMIVTKEPNIDQERLTGLLAASAEMVFNVMLQEQSQPKKPAPETDGGVLHDGIISFIGLAGEWSGTGSVLCSGSAALSIASKLLLFD